MIKRPRRANRQRSVVDTVESELRIFAHELHGGLVQNLCAMSVLAKVLDLQFDKIGLVKPAELRQLQQTIDAAIDETRLVITQLHPPDLEEGGLVDALRNLTNLTNQLRPCQFQHRGKHPLDLAPADALAVFRIAQGAVRTALRQRGLAQVQIELVTSTQAVKLRVRERRSRPRRARPPLPRSTHLMESYAQLIGATLTITQTTDGTLLACTLPTGPGRR